MAKAWFEIAEDAHEIIRRDGLSESEIMEEGLMDNLINFVKNYNDMREMLGDLQKFLMGKAKEARKNSQLMGDGAYLKAYNASQKVDIQLDKMNKEAKIFIDLMKDVLQRG